MADIHTLRNEDLIRSVFRKIFLPALAAGASANLSGIIDGIIVGNTIGSDALAAVNACRPAMHIYAFVAKVFATGLANRVVVALGRNEKENANRIFSAGTLAAVITSAALVIVQLVFMRRICVLFGGDGTLFPMVMQYYRIVLFSIFFVVISEPMAAAMRTDGLPLMSGVALLLPHILNAVLDVLFINVCGWGLAGAALATVLGYLVGFLLCCYYFFFRKSYRLSFGETREKLGGILSAGLPPTLSLGLISIKLLVVNRVALAVGGPFSLAVISPLMAAWGIQSIFIGGVVQAVMPMLSLYYGVGDYHGVRAVFRYSLKILLGLVMGLTLLLEICPQVLPFLFGMRDPIEVARAVPAIRIFALHLPMEAFIMLTVSYYAATDNKKIAGILSVLQGLAAMLAVIYPLTHFWGINGVWASFPAADLIPLAIIAVLSHGDSERFFRLKGHTYLKEFSVDYSRISQLVEEVIGTVCDAGFDKAVANRTGIAIEEMAVSAFERNTGIKLHVDVTVRKIDNSLLITFADDGVRFDPLRDGRPAETGLIDNIAMLRAVSHKIEYTRVMGLNKTDITLQ